MSFIAPSEQTSLFKYRDDHEICWSVTKGSSLLEECAESSPFNKECIPIIRFYP